MALISSKFLHGECECSVRSGIRVLRKKFDRRIKFRAVSEATLYTRWRPLGAYFFVSPSESHCQGVPVLEKNKKETRHRSRANGILLYPDRRGRERETAIGLSMQRNWSDTLHWQIHFFFTLERNLGRRTSDSAAFRKPAFVSRPLNCAKKKCEREKNIFPR